MRPVRAEEDPSRTARVVRRVSLMYRGGADAGLDRPAHVRSASGLCRWRGRLAVVSDDASFAGMVDAASGLVEAVTVPHAPDGRRQFDTTRGNKADKLDLECAICARDRLIGFGSDSGLAVRRQVVVIDAAGGVRVVAVPRLYAALRRPELGRGALNLEGAARAGDRLFLGNRGGDLGDDGAPTVDAIAELPLAALLALVDDPDGAPLPDVRWQRLELGMLDGAALRLTELEAADDAGARLYFAATAEATASAFDDGEVTGSAIGWIDLHASRARWCRIVDEHGAPLVAKIEGLAMIDDAGAGPGRLLATVDADDPGRASDLLELAVAPPPF